MSIMPDINQVIKSLENCSCIYEPDCTHCYQQGPGLGFACRDGLMKDALYLLKEYQRPVVPKPLVRHGKVRWTCECGGRLDTYENGGGFPYCKCCGKLVKWDG